MSVFVELFVTFLCSVGAGMVTYLACSRLFHSRLDALPLRQPLGRSRHTADKIVVVIALVYMLVFGSLSVLKYYSLTVPGTDLAQYDQLVWNTLHGRILENTIVRDAHLYLEKAFTPILLDIVPLYAIWGSPVVLLLIQTVGIGLSGLPLYWFARERLGPWLGLILTITYYVSPALANVNLDEFHEIALAVPLLSLALYFLLRYRYKPFLATLAVTFLVKDEIAIIAMGLGLYILLVQKAKRVGVALTVFSGLFILLLLQVVIPSFRGAQPGSFYYVGRYGYLGQTVSEIVRTIVTRPDIVLQHVVIPGKIEYVLQLLVPLAFIPLVGIEVFLLTLPIFGYTLLSDVSWQYSVKTLYPAPLLPFLSFAAIVGLQRLSTWSRQNHPGSLPNQKPGVIVARQWALGAVMLTAGLLSYYLQGQGPLARSFQSELYVLHPDSFVKEGWMRSIPFDAVVVAQNEFLPHVSDRQYVYEIPSIPDCRQADYMVADSDEFWYKVHLGYWGECLATGYFSTTLQSKGFVIVQPRVPEHPLLVKFGKPLTLLAYSVQPQVTMSGGMTFQPILLLQANDSAGLTSRVVMQIVDAQGHVWSRQDRVVGALARADQRQAGKPISDQYRLDLPVTIPAGEYQMTVGVHPPDSEDNVQAMDDQGNSLGSEIVLTTVRIEKNKSSVTASELEIEQPHQADMQELRLLGYVPPRETITPGELLQVGLYWRARAQPRGDYAVAVQLRDSSGHVAFEQVERPAQGTYPTRNWETGEVLLDWHDFNLPKDIAPGEYEIAVALRDTADQRVIGQTTLRPISILPRGP